MSGSVRGASPLLLALLIAASLQSAAAAPAPREQAPADGWAGQDGGTRGGAGAAADKVFTVSTRSALLAALAQGGSTIIEVAGTIDMSEGRPYASSAEQAQRGAVKLRSNTTLIGRGPDAGLINAHIQIIEVNQVIVRNLNLRNPCDVGPVWDPNDGAHGEWNSLFDGITVAGSTHVWIDHNSFTDAPLTDDQAAIENGRPKQCHDGALDISRGADFVTVSYNRFEQHEKNMLIGSSDKASGDDGHLRVTLSNNVFADIAARAPRVRFGQVHTFNNYHTGDRKHPVYPHTYSIGVGKQSHIISTSNAFEVAGAKNCDQIVHNPGGNAPAGAFSDTGSLLNGQALGACKLTGDVGWTVPYPFKPLPAADVKAHALANAGAETARRGATLASAAVVAVATGCGEGALFCDSFTGPGLDNWTIPPGRAAITPSQSLRLDAGTTVALLNQAQMAAAPSGDYFIEARLRAMPGASGKLYVLGRYIDEKNWLGAGLTLNAGSPTVQAELMRQHGGTLERLKQVKRTVVSEGRFLTVRLEMIGSALAVYLNGEKLTIATDTALLARGTVGLYASGGAFEVDDVRIGDAAVKPARLAPALSGNSMRLQAGDPAQAMAVSAFGGDGVTPRAFGAATGDTGVATVSLRDGAVLVQPKAPGRTSITLTSVSDPTVQSIVDLTVLPAYLAPAGGVQAAALRKGALAPAANAVAVPPDTVLRLQFDQAPSLGTGGSVRIFRQSDNALVDVIRPGDDIVTLGYRGQELTRNVRHTPISVSGNTALIKPHPNRLAYGDAYYVVIEDGVFKDARLGGKAFAGIGPDAGWRFRTSAAAPAGRQLTVDDDGPADFRTVQGALNHAMQAYPKAAPVTILVKDGDYDEMLFIRAKDNLTLRGQSREGVLVHSGNNDGYNPGSGLSQSPQSPSFNGGRSLLMIEEADLLTIENLTLKNTTLRSDKISGQAETIYFNTDTGRLIARNASFFSEQDTVQVKGYAWFYRTLVAGNVDFIWGANRAALFEESEIRSVGDSAGNEGGGYVVQARTVTATDPGFVFLNSRLTHGVGPGPKANDIAPGSTYLARSPGTAATWDNVSYINCRMDRHVASVGWAVKGVQRQPAQNPLVGNAASGWREYGSVDLAGKPIDLGARVGGYTLSAADVAQRFANRAQIFAGYDNGRGWTPLP